MNHYKRHIGDWMRDTAHLSMSEEGAYTRLTDQYYSRERPIPAEKTACYKLARASSKEEREAVDYVLGEYFELSPDGYRQKRCDQELAAYQQKSERNREVGRKGGRPAMFVQETETQRPSSTNPEETQTVSESNQKRNPDGSCQETQTVSEKNPSHKPLAISQEKKKAKGADAPWRRPDWIDAEAWAGYEEMRRRVRKPMTDRARELIVSQLARLREAGHDPAAVLDQSTQNSWQGVFELKQSRALNGHQPVPATPGLADLIAARGGFDE